MIHFLLGLALAMLALGILCGAVIVVWQILALPFRFLMWISWKWAPPNDVAIAMLAAERDAQQSLRDSRL